MRSTKEIKEEMRKVKRAIKMHEVRLGRSKKRYAELEAELDNVIKNNKQEF